MKFKSITFFILLLTGLSFFSHGQSSKYTVQNAHSHNDYENDVPFLTAYKAGFGSIEADVFPVKGKLYVAHDKQNIDFNKSLRTLYLEPAARELRKERSRCLILLVDIKEDYKTSLALLVTELKPFKDVIKNKRLQIVISGTRPVPGEFNKYPSYIWFDDDQSRKSNSDQWKRVALVSLRFSNLCSWKGQGEIRKEESLRLKSTIDSVHAAGKKIRFWGAPDSPEAWTALVNLGADLIGTDRIEDLTVFLRSKKYVK